ncbi:hypothetical protein C1H46_035890 [Malus baccata]|uniref:Uncharacterized protein n=1 Tax=Malus baccata TaxID=106549 RepID=A0A540KWH6_MALBA|nr:hypothetical protein C1H46_035890 [Malus baccata]
MIAELNKVFVAVGFPKLDPDKSRTALEHTDSLLWMEYRKTKWNQPPHLDLEELCTKNPKSPSTLESTSAPRGSAPRTRNQPQPRGALHQDLCDALIVREVDGLANVR